MGKEFVNTRQVSPKTCPNARYVGANNYVCGCQGKCRGQARRRDNNNSRKDGKWK